MKILLVDDSRSSRCVTSAYLLEMGYPLTEAVDGIEALEIYRRDRPDLVITDVEMPGMDGYTLAREIRRNDSIDDWVPIIFLSGCVGDEDIAKGLEAGGDGYILKPVSPIVLGAKLKAMKRITDMRRRLLELSTELQAANRALIKVSQIDALTNVANRRSFDGGLEREWYRAQRSGRPLGMILCDVDYFKRYNDRYGHAQGDACLCAVAEAIAKLTRRSTDVLARYGGEEFVMLLTDADEAVTMAVARAMREAVAALALVHADSDVASHVTISLGVTVCIPDRSLNSADLFKFADAALYDAKGQGRNRVCLRPFERPAAATAGPTAAIA
ncbi:MAG: diguanylate cyclase response regulator [Hydrocarboniphaga sp.]|uniref:diguanylate cyclase domain-containing protein n=1 Tax=Hydrocarboniphaga sp. TaxID=2033016 RepID=UPI002601E259|nr:diguanylate cyclase [Hydrocarboniphaga sp.]MDB5973046.1 diguanylate cyclase response regulator [Hydrocarboniphaga sp.]